MIPILYNQNETSFTSNGLGRLTDAISCEVTEERNGKYELVMVYPTNGIHYGDIAIGMYIAAIHSDARDIQPFIIYRIEEEIDGRVTINAHHLSYMLNGIVVKPFTASSITMVMTKLGTESINTNPFTFWTDKSTVGSFEVDTPRGIRSLLGGAVGSILDVYGTGEYEFDKWDVKLYQSRGQATDVSIRYGVNMSDYQHNTDDSEAYNAVVPFWADEEGSAIVTLPEWYLTPTGITPSRLRLFAMDLSESFQSAPTEAQLRSAAQNRLDNSEAWIPAENFKVSFVQLWQTAEYESVAVLQRLNLCDSALVVYGGTTIREKVISATYDTLRDRYVEMELGEPKTSFANMILKEAAQIVTKAGVTKTALQEAIDYATEMIQGGLGGHLVINTDSSGHPDELLIMDTADTSTAVNVWRFNAGGLGHSHSGYNGPFNDVALTADGKINASMITVGTLTANLIKAGVIADTANKNSWDLSTGQLITTLGLIGGWTIASDSLSKEITVGGITYRVKLKPPTSLNDDFIILQKNQNDVWYTLIGLSQATGLKIFNEASNTQTVALDSNGLVIYKGTSTNNSAKTQISTSQFIFFDDSGHPITTIGNMGMSCYPSGDANVGGYTYIGGSGLYMAMDGVTKFSVSDDALHFYNENGNSVFGIVYTSSIREIRTKLNIIPTGSGQTLGDDICRWSQIYAQGIEIAHDTTGYIDFHYNKDTYHDYTARIIEESSGVLKAYNSIASASDKRLKENITELSEAEKRLILSLKPKQFNFIGNETKYAGLIAQDVLEAEEEEGIEESLLVRGTGKEIPDPKHEGETMTDYYAVDYNSLTTLLLAQVQELTKTVEDLKAKLAKLEGGK